MRENVKLVTAGVGIIIYSPFAMAGVREGEDYLTTAFTNPAQVAQHLSRCDVAAFCTGSGGDYELVISDGSLDEVAVSEAAFKVRLGLEVRDGEVCFRDLYDLMDWSAECPARQRVRLADGFYRVTVFSSPPPSGILGDGQRIHLHVEKVAERPMIQWDAIPQLC
jgi:hypothetical protein